MKNRNQYTATVFSLFCVLSCVQKLSTSETHIVGGSLVAPNDTVYKATVSLDANGIPYCSGALFDKRTIVTAAHCIHGTPSEKSLSIGFGSQQTGNKISVAFSREQMLAHPNWTSADLMSTNIDPLPQQPKNDIAIIVLNQDAPDWTQAAPLKLIGPVNTGDTVILAGYGQTQMIGDKGYNPQTEVRGLLRRVDVQLETINNAGWEFIYKPLPQTPQGTSCHGDSGGPMFFKEGNGAITLIGVTSRAYNKAEDCNGRGVYTDARKFDAWIRTQRDEILKKIGPSSSEWEHRALKAKDATVINIDFQLTPRLPEKIARTIWVNVVNSKFTGTEKVKDAD